MKTIKVQADTTEYQIDIHFTPEEIAEQEVDWGEERTNETPEYE